MSTEKGSSSEEQQKRKAFVHHLAALSFQTVMHDACILAPTDTAAKSLIKAAIECGMSDILSPDIVFSLIHQWLGQETVDECRRVFNLLTTLQTELTHPKLFTKKSSLQFLLLCNTMLRRLSKTRDTSFSGEVLSLMSKMYPLDERSGLNLPRSFNTDNTTLYEGGEGEGKEETSTDMEVEGAASGSDDHMVDKRFVHSLSSLSLPHSFFLSLSLSLSLRLCLSLSP